MAKLNNLVSFNDFTKSWSAESAKKTARTDVAKDILAQKGRGEDVETKHVTDKSTTTSNGLAKNVIRSSGDYNDGARTVKDTARTVSNGLSKEVVK